MPLPTDAKARKNVPLHSGLVVYFKDALIEVARLSQAGNDQHNPGQPLHWTRDKSSDHEDCILRHHFEAGTVDTDGVRHSAKRAWRALAALQIEIEEELEAGRREEALAVTEVYNGKEWVAAYSDHEESRG